MRCSAQHIYVFCLLGATCAGYSVLFACFENIDDQEFHQPKKLLKVAQFFSHGKICSFKVHGHQTLLVALDKLSSRLISNIKSSTQPWF